MNKSNNTILDFLKAGFEALKKWLVKYSKIVLPIILVICVGLTIVIAIQANKRKVEQEEAVVASDENAEDEGALIEVPDVPLEKDAVPGINELINKYYKAMVEGDTDTMGELVYYLDANEILRAKETSKYLEDYPTLEVYTKPGPREGCYLVLAYMELKFYDYDKPIPGMNVYYVCTNEDGEFYINQDGDENEGELQYMRKILVQNDVIDLNNRVTVAFNDMVAEDGTLKEFLTKLDEEIDVSVGETLASATENEETESEPAEEAPTEEETQEPEVVVSKVKTTDVVNIRTSDSETADKLGKAAVGDEFELLEEKGNGWSKIRYNDGEAFIKSEFLEPSETKTASTDEEPDEEEEEPQQTAESANVTGTVTVQETVKIRKGASTSSDQIDTVYAGTKLDVIMKQADGWTKIKYNGQTAYVKSDYVK